MSNRKYRNPTRGGVYHDLDKSVYTTSRNGVVFFFSSELYKNKFLEGLEEQREEFDYHLNKKIDGRFLNLDWLADIHLYRQVEKRGFYVEVGGCEVTWLELCQFASRNVISKNTSDYEETQKQK